MTRAHTEGTKEHGCQSELFVPVSRKIMPNSHLQKTLSYLSNAGPALLLYAADMDVLKIPPRWVKKGRELEGGGPA